jgi:hypothetical protein
MERYKSYGAVHKGLRNGLSQMLFLACNTDYSNAASVEKIYKLGQKLFKLMSSHAEDENNIMLAELETRMQGAAHHDTHDHEVIEAGQKNLETMLDEMYSVVNNGGNATPIGEEFYTAYSRFFGEYMLHMVHEETITQQQLWDNFTDAELIGLTQRIVSKLPIDKTMDWYSFMIPAMNPAERAGMYTMLNMTLPVEVFQVIDAGIKQFLPADEYGFLKQQISAIA